MDFKQSLLREELLIHHEFAMVLACETLLMCAFVCVDVSVCFIIHHTSVLYKLCFVLFTMRISLGLTKTSGQGESA